MIQLAPLERDRGQSRGYLGLVLLAAVGLALGCLSVVAMPKAYAEATIIPQAGADPVVIDQAATTDITTVLTGGSAAHVSSDVPFKSEADGSFGDIVKYAGLIMPASSPADTLSWNVEVAAAARYDIAALVRANAGQKFRLAVSVSGGSPSSSTSVTAISTGVDDRLAAGQLSLPAGTSTIMLSRTGVVSGDATIRSIELLPGAKVTTYNAAVAAARAAATRR